MAALLSTLCPGLGQFYNGQWGKGAGFLLGFLILAGILLGSADPVELPQAAESGAPVEHIGELAILVLLLLAVALWSIVDAARTTRRSNR